MESTRPYLRICGLPSNSSVDSLKVFIRQYTSVPVDEVMFSQDKQGNNQNWGWIRFDTSSLDEMNDIHALLVSHDVKIQKMDGTEGPPS